MAGNFLISSDEEKRINDILEKGIYEIKSSKNVMRKERDKIVDDFLKSSIGNINNSNETNANSNSNCEENSKRERNFIFNTNSSRNEHIYDSNGNYLNKKYEENIHLQNPKNNLNKENFTRQIIFNNNSKLLNVDSSKINNKNLSSNPKSSALRNLLDEMKQNSKYISSSEDECVYTQKFNCGNLPATKNKILDIDNQKNFKQDLDLYAELNQDLNPTRDLKIFKENQKMDPILRTERTLSENSILLKESCANINTPDLMKTNTLTPDNSYRNDNTNLILKDDLTSVHQPVQSIDTDFGNFSQLTDIHSEIKNLQKKIDGLEKKLKSSVSVTSNNDIGHLINNINAKTNFRDMENKRGGNNCNIVNKSKRFKKSVSDDEAEYNSVKNKFRKLRMHPPLNIQPIYSKNHSVIKEDLSKRSISSSSEKYNPEGGKYKKSIVALKSKLDYKEKFEKIKENYDSVKTTLIKERQIIGHLKNKNKKLTKKEENYDKLFKSHQELKEEHQKLFRKFEESEYIRSEQSHLIKSMQKEIDLLRSQFDGNNERENKKIIDENKNRKEIEKSSSKVKNSKKRKFSSSKTKTAQNPTQAKNFL